MSWNNVRITLPDGSIHYTGQEDMMYYPMDIPLPIPEHANDNDWYFRNDKQE